MRYIFLGYVVAEVAVFWAMAHFLGFAWAFLITLIAAAVGYAVLGRRARTVGAEIGRAMRREIAPGRPLSDSALFGVAALLTILPGVVSTVVGLILMTSPARRMLRPLVAATATRRATRITGFGFDPHRYVDGTVDADITDTTVRNPDGSIYVDVPRLPRTAQD